MAASSSNSSSRTITLQLEQQHIASDSRLQADGAVTLTLAPRLKKKVSWKVGTVDNELLEKKSSKKCCIFHEAHEEDNSDDEL